MISWAHANTDWDQNQTAQWEQAVKEFAQLLRICGVDVDLDLWHLSERGVVKKRVTRYMSDWVSAPVGSWSKQAGDPPYGCG